MAGLASGASGSEKISRKERKSSGELPGLEETKPFPATISSGFAPPSVQSSPLTPHQRLQGERWTWRWQGWCGAGSPSCFLEAAPQIACFPSVLALVLLWPCPSPLMPGAVLLLRSQNTQHAGPGAPGDSSRIRGMATPPGSQQRSPGWLLAKYFCSPLPSPLLAPCL